MDIEFQHISPWKLASPLKTNGWKIEFLLKWSLFFRTCEFSVGIPNCCNLFPNMGKQEYLKYHRATDFNKLEESSSNPAARNPWHDSPTTNGKAKIWIKMKETRLNHLEFWGVQPTKKTHWESEQLSCFFFGQNHWTASLLPNTGRFFRSRGEYWHSPITFGGIQPWAGGAELKLWCDQ